jgi:hypothetical protein
MRQVIVKNLDRQQVRPVVARYCADFYCQLRGLTFRRTLPDDQGLLLVQRADSRIEAAIHMLFVYFDLAVIWINNAGQVVDVRLARRWRPAYLPKAPARYILELAASRLGDFKIGDHVEILEASYT